MPATMLKLLPRLMPMGSNLFMTFARSGQLRFKDQPPWLAILVGWGNAFFEYCLAVPANHRGGRGLHLPRARAAGLVPSRNVPG